MALQPDLRDELLRRREIDQAPRRRGITAETAAEMDAVDAQNTAWLAHLVDAHGWPGWARVGRDGARAAWLLVQHADHDVAFQRRCLGLLARAVAADDADPVELAYLTDRVAVNEGRAQTYGTQLDDDGTPRPILDPERVDERRASVGLAPLAEYVAQFRASTAALAPPVARPRENAPPTLSPKGEAK